jgi:hypothetical protein
MINTPDAAKPSPCSNPKSQLTGGLMAKHPGAGSSSGKPIYFVFIEVPDWLVAGKFHICA